MVKKKKQDILQCASTNKRAKGAGRKPKLGLLEELLADEIVDLRIMKVKVTRSFIAERARIMALEHGIQLDATGRWITGFMKRYGFSLRRMTNLSTLTDDQLLQRAVDYLSYLHNRLPFLNLAKTLLMDETAVYFEDTRTQTVDLTGRKYVVINSTGFASMRITAIMSVWADGRKATPLVIHKGKATGVIARQTGPILYTTQEKAWVEQTLICKWIDAMFPLIDTSPGKCIVWDSCRAHIAKSVKDHCRKRNIELIVIPGGMTPYLQAGDIAIFKGFKNHISKIINAWKTSGKVQYTKGGNPKPPENEIVRSWVLDSWRAVSLSSIKNSISAAGFSNNSCEWHISKHDLYGMKFQEAWVNAGNVEVTVEDFEEIPQDDDIE